MLLHILKLPRWPIMKQLQLEEALLRADDRNWCLLNEGSDPAIVMGISGKQEQLIDPVSHAQNPIPVIRRFSGGGTVVVDQNTFFATFICNTKDTQVDCFPDKVLCWTKTIYSDVFYPADFQLKENDYSLGNRKFGGNAQYMRKGRWLHHSSLLWDYDPDHMKLLKIPPKMPEYRKKRNHEDFLCRLKDHLPEKTNLEESLLSVLESKWNLELVSLEQVTDVLERPHRRSTTLIPKQPQ